MAQTFSKRRRLRAQSEYRRVQGHGVRFSCASVLLLVDRSPQGGGSMPRLGMVVSRKIGSAVKRNVVKRWLREWFRSSTADLPRGVDLVVIAKRGAVERGHRALIADVGSLVSRVTGSLR